MAFTEDSLTFWVTLIWAVIGFLCGSLMFSYWIGRWVLHRDIRLVGDGNPGATNLLKAGSGAKGIALGIFALLLDALKGALPVAMAKYVLGLTGVPLVIVALSPIFGHAFSPFMRLKGGKGVAVTAGVWTALTLWEAPTLGGILLGLWFSVVEVSGWAVLLMGLSMLAYYLLTSRDPVLLAVLVVNLLLLAWKYRADLRHRPGLRGWIKRRLPAR
ncbi:MAG: glycerol-3-phosphate acyltransferase [Chloroflexota bacterium]